MQKGYLRPMSMTQPRRALLGVLVLILVALGAACTPAQIELFLTLPKEDQDKVVAELQAQQAPRPTDCYSAMEQVFPAHAHGWARGIIKRESGNRPNAANPSSSARGCWQLLSSLHGDKYAAAGCHVSQWSDPMCNTRAAYVLYQRAGTSPWRL